MSLIINIIIIIRYLVVFHKGLSDGKSHLCLSKIQVDFNNAVVRIVSIHPVISNFSSLFSKPKETVPRASTVIVTTVYFFSFSVLWQYHLSGVKSFASSLVSLSFGSFVWIPPLFILRMVQWIFQREILMFLFVFFWGTVFWYYSFRA